MKAPWRLASCAALFLALLAAYSNSFNTSFHFDDEAFFLKNPVLHIPDLSWPSIKHLLLNPDPPQRPFAAWGFALNLYFFKFNPMGYHIINFLIHTINAGLVFLLLLFTLRPEKENPKESSFKILTVPALLAAFWWALLPVHTQAVTYIWQRIAAAAALGCLLSLIGYSQAIKTGNKKWHWATVLGALFAFGNKEFSATLPVLAVLYDMVFICRMNFKEINRVWKRWIPWALTAMIVVYWYSLYPSQADIAHTQLLYADPPSYTQRLLTGARAILHYLSLTLFPHPSRLMVDYAFPVSRSLWEPPFTAAAILILLSLAAAGLWFLKKFPFFGFGLLWFLGNCVIEAVSPTTDLAAEQRIYFPSIGIAFIAAALLKEAAARRIPAAAPASIALIILGFWTWHRNKVWATEITLWQDNVLKAPHNPRAFANLGLALAKAGRQEEAFPAYERAIALAPKYDLIYRNYGIALFSSGRIDEAIRQYEKSIELAPDEAETYYNLGYAYFAKGQWAKAVQVYERGLQCPYPPPKLHLSLGNAYLRKGDFMKAREAYQAGMALNPGNPFFYLRLGDILYLQAKPSEALDFYRQAAAINPALEERAIRTAQFLIERRRNPGTPMPQIVELPQYWGPEGEK